MFTSNFRMHQPYQGEAKCPEGARYKTQVAAQRTKEIEALQRLTGWSSSEIAQRIR